MGRTTSARHSYEKGLPLGEGEDEGETPAPVYGKEWNEMEQNGTELKVLPLLATRNEANQGRLARRRYPLPLGEGQGEGCAKRGQSSPPPRRSREGGQIPSPSGRGLG